MLLLRVLVRAGACVALVAATFFHPKARNLDLNSFLSELGFSPHSVGKADCEIGHDRSLNSKLLVGLASVLRHLLLFGQRQHVFFLIPGMQVC